MVPIFKRSESFLSKNYRDIHLTSILFKIAERFSIQVTEKAVAQAAPAIGAAGGAIINTIFIDHFQDMAKGHFTIRKLEKLYGKEDIKYLYEEMRKSK